ncbi:MAG: DUF4440 domain-containing protein [Gemmatimonadota bacterium]|nr:DUF4440 domain-containing protein [Gemmatimonadota bacterium]
MRRPTVLLLCAAVAVSACARAPVIHVRGDPDPRIQRLVSDYTGLWRRETLPQWEQLFLPGFTVASTNADGSITVRSREDFLAAQRRYHERVSGLREDLENVRLDRRGRLASVWADYVVTEGPGGATRRGRLVLLAIEDRGEYRFHSLMFSYHG